MEEKQQRKSVRDEFAEKFICALETDGLKWEKGWGSGGFSLPYNGQTERRYNGINRLILIFKAMEMGWLDPRYYTFHQVSQMDGCKICAGEKATAVEYWLVRDTKDKRSMTFSEYEKLLKDDPSRKEVEFYAYPKVAYVFNAAQIEGLQLLPQPERPPLEENKLAEEVIKTMAENMEVRMIYGGDEAFYRPATDTVHLPPQDAFFTVNDWTSTALHELAHATSAPSRLDSNVHFLLILSSNNSASLTTEIATKMAGSYYERNVSISENNGSSTTTSFAEKPVLKPEDLNNLGDDAVLIITNYGYVRVNKSKVAYYKHPFFKPKYEKNIAVNQEAMVGV